MKSESLAIIYSVAKYEDDDFKVAQLLFDDFEKSHDFGESCPQKVCMCSKNVIE